MEALSAWGTQGEAVWIPASLAPGADRRTDGRTRERDTAQEPLGTQPPAGTAAHPGVDGRDLGCTPGGGQLRSWMRIQVGNREARGPNADTPAPRRPGRGGCWGFTRIPVAKATLAADGQTPPAPSSPQAGPQTRTGRALCCGGGGGVSGQGLPEDPRITGFGFARAAAGDTGNSADQQLRGCHPAWPARPTELRVALGRNVAPSPAQRPQAGAAPPSVATGTAGEDSVPTASLGPPRHEKYKHTRRSG